MSGVAASVVMGDPGEQADQAGLQWTDWLAEKQKKPFYWRVLACRCGHPVSNIEQCSAQIPW